MVSNKDKILGLDLGDRHIGVALLDLSVPIVLPLPALANNRQFLKSLKTLIKEQNITKIVAGLPLTLSGSESPQTGKAKALASKIAESTGVELQLHDERLTSRQATSMLQDSANHPPHHQDSVAAQLILQSWLEQQ